MDYANLGALLGSAWRHTHPDALPITAELSGDALITFMKLQGNRAFEDTLRRTMQGRCYGCGTDHEVGTEENGVYCCEYCVGM